MKIFSSPLKSEPSALSAHGVDATGVGARAWLLGIHVALLRGHVYLLVFVSANTKAVDASFGIGIASARSSDLKFRLNVIVSGVG